MRPTGMIMICKYYIKLRQGVSILCLADPSVKSKVSALLLRKLGTLDP